MTETAVSQVISVLLCIAVGWAVYQIMAAAILHAAVRLSRVGINGIAISGGKLSASFGTLPLMRVSMTAKVENLYTGEKTRVKISRAETSDGLVEIAVSGADCGVLRGSVSDVRVSLFGAVVSKKLGGEKSCRALIPPPDVPLPQSVCDRIAFRDPDGQPDSVREYTCGDRLSDIHMKLSAKCGRYMVRERHDRRQAGRVEIAFCYEREHAGKNAALLSAAVRTLMTAGVHCTVLFGGENFTVSSTTQLNALLFRALSRHSGGAAAADMVICGGEVRVL